MEAREEQIPNQYLLTALVGSLVVHLLMAFFLFRAYSGHKTAPLLLEATIELPQKLLKPNAAQPAHRQIVTPPDSSLSTPLPDTNLLSDRDSAAPKEQIKRGDAPDAGPLRGDGRPAAPALAVRKPGPATIKEPQKQPEQAARNLLLDQRTVLEKFGDLSAQPTPPNARAPHTADLSGYQAFSRPSGSGAAIFGMQGSNDYLPYLPDGDITLLNAKAEHFAVFVRRVALQVFSNLRQSGWEHLAFGDIRRVSGFTGVRAILSPQGKLVRIILDESSGSDRFDAVLKDAVQRGAQDSNPPEQARTPDGTIHFIFKARCWAEGAVNSRGLPSERRWLLLSTGLE